MFTKDDRLSANDMQGRRVADRSWIQLERDWPATGRDLTSAVRLDVVTKASWPWNPSPTHRTPQTSPGLHRWGDPGFVV